MRWEKFISLVAFAYIAFTSLFAYATVQVRSTPATEHNNHTKMADNWIPIRQNNRGRGNQRGGGRGGRLGRPSSPGIEQRTPGSPIANTISVQQGVPSTDDNLLKIFLEVLILALLFASHRITVVLAHAKHDGCGFISKNPTLPRLPESKHTKKQNHSIHRNRLSRAAPIFLLIILASSNVLATNNIHSQKRYCTTDIDSVDTPDSLDEQRRNFYEHNNNNCKIIKHAIIKTTQTNKYTSNDSTKKPPLTFP